MNRIQQLFLQKKNNILSVYFTAGYPKLTDTGILIKTLAKSGVDMIEVGMPFSDPLADGPVIQHSSEIALLNGITMKLYFEQIFQVRSEVDLPLIFMGYLNMVIQFGPENFCAHCKDAGIDGVILPDMPVEIYKKEFRPIFEKYDLYPVFLITPQTSEERIKQLDAASKGFLYIVSSSSTTGIKHKIEHEQIEYFKRIQKIALKNPGIIGFGISNKDTFQQACAYAHGAIIGSAYIKILENSTDIEKDTQRFIEQILY
ncbi:MAG: tryptophan synthase subunit alpha [Bacteroidales bacterium]|nr:tryptophan synthase subunit alpha [Bacteroidales bacterium]